MILYIFSTLFLISLYGSVQLALARSWDQLKAGEDGGDGTPYVTVIVPVRNEELNISACLWSLARQEYDVRFYEIILVDNHSTDGTLTIARKISREISNLKVIDLSPVLHADKAFKKHALRAGLDQARGHYVLTTDGDCNLPTQWISTMVQALENPEVDFVTGLVRMQGGHDFLSQYQSIDMAGLMVATGGGIASGSLLLANGANMGFVKNRFEQLGGYQTHIETASGDDVFLVQSLYLRDQGLVRFVKDKTAIVTTESVKTYLELLQQRRRWASKTGKFSHRPTKAISVLVFLNSLGILIHLPLIGVFGKMSMYLFLLHFLSKMLADHQLIGRGLTHLDLSPNRMTLFLAHLFNPLLNVAVGFSILASKRYRWKGRTAS